TNVGAILSQKDAVITYNLEGNTFTLEIEFPFTHQLLEDDNLTKVNHELQKHIIFSNLAKWLEEKIESEHIVKITSIPKLKDGFGLKMDLEVDDLLATIFVRIEPGCTTLTGF